MGRVAITDSMPEFSGRFIDNGRLKLLESLGSGAYGKVYRALAVTSPLDKPTYYAVKCLLKPERGSYQEEFQNREFTLHQMVCDHPNVVTLHKVIYEDGYVYVVLDLCQGGDLFAAITETQTFHNNVQLIKNSFVQLIDAVQYCHENSVFHRDIKPENVLCSQHGTDLRLADFGLAIRSHVSSDFGCGSSYYMSPECIGKELTVGRYSTRHSDIWSLGVILTNMISGRNPWRYATTKDDCFAAYLHDRDFLRSVLPISNNANTILKRIFNINPLCRISLPDLRKEILNVDTFFMTREELSTAAESVRKVAKNYSQGNPQSAPQVGISHTLLEGEGSDDTDSSVSSDERYVFRSPPDDQSPPRPTLSASLRDIPRSRDITDISTNTSGSPSENLKTSGSSTSDTDSDGPITPTTYPTDPAVEVPDLAPEEGLGQSAAYIVEAGTFGSATSSPKRSTPRRSQLIRKAFQRIKALSSSSASSA
ncbi:kinase-like domain-containing protein [Collybia nuda]|uniref:Kinase-like domain-containing protein n=1 Tax=Collybia nuda TaxID=64659 RepID=A0A9P6CL17_9AGAR|nr:kinase-like domain-containing protein [Collybia nuda]